MKLTPKQIEDFKDIGFEGLLKMKHLVYIVILTIKYAQALVYILAPFTALVQYFLSIKLLS